MLGDEAPILEVVNDVIVRPPSLDDAHGVAELIAERDRVDFAEVDPIAFTGGLEVDSENEFGATRLYESAGMRVTRRYATYEKALV